jgi:hypothetical protein
VKDPILFASHSTNHYLYVSNNSINLIDVSGTINAGQFVSVAAVFAAATDLINTILDIGINKEIKPSDYISFGLDFWGIAAGTYNFQAFSRDKNSKEAEDNPISFLENIFGFKEGLVDLTGAMVAGASVAMMGKINTSFKKVVYTSNLVMAIYAFGKFFWKLDDYQ